MDVLILALELSGIAVFVSIGAIQVYCIRHDIISSLWDLRNFNGPEFVFRYRDHTLTRFGRVGYWYRALKVSGLIFLITMTVEVVLQLRTASGPVVFLVAFCSLLLVPLLGYAIYRMSKESYL